MFYRRSTDGMETPVGLENQYAGPVATACWIVGGGPSLTAAVADQIQQSPAPKFAMNLAGSGLLRPQFWTSYDPTCRFHRSIYLDPSITKFVHQGRGMDLVPGTGFKVCDCPSLFLIDRDKTRGFHNFPGQGTSPITDWQDSLIQTIEIAYRLGFRRLYLVGTDCCVTPSSDWKRQARAQGVTYQYGEPLTEFARRCERNGMTRTALETFSTGPQYHFDESKSLTAAIQTDFHYFRVCQYLRLARRSMALAGLQLISATPHSRLNTILPRLPVLAACRQILKTTGHPSEETTRGNYALPRKESSSRAGMRDFRPHFWPTPEGPVRIPPAPGDRTKSKAKSSLRAALAQIPDIPIPLNEEG